MTEGPLWERKVLVVEDEMIVGMFIEDVLLAAGCAVIGPVGRLEDALALAGEATIDIALLDINLNGRETYPIADLLDGRGIPYVFATGYGAAGLRSAYGGAPTLQKPFQETELVRMLASALARTGR